MTKFPLRTSFLQTSFFKNVLLSSMLAPQLLLAGCTVGLSDESLSEGEVNCEDSAPALLPTLLHDPSSDGLVQSALTAADTSFVTDDYDAVLVNINSADHDTLVPVITDFLIDGKHVVLDSTGTDAERSMIAQLAGTVTGMAANESALSILEDAPGVFVVTAIDTTQQFNTDGQDSGNTPLNLLANPDAAPNPACADNDDAPQLFASDTTTRSSYQGKNKPVPPIVRVLVDNKTQYDRDRFSGSEERRYLEVGDPHYCSPNAADNCTFRFDRSISKAIAHGTKIDVNFANTLTEKLTGGVTFGYSLTVTNTHTLTWSNSHPVAPGYSARPVSYVIRRTGEGKVKNAYIFQSRRKVHSPCRPSGGCYRYTDTYVRERNTEVGTWLADVAMNGGAPTTSWVIFPGEIDTKRYVMDR